MTTLAPVPAELTAPVAASADPGAVYRVLIADDYPIAREFLTRMLDRLGHHAEAVSDGAEAIAALRARRYDLLLLDLSMPNVDGFAVLRWLRAQDGPMPHVAVVSALAVEHRPALDALGVTTLLPKPVRRAQLAEVLAALPPRAL